MAYASGVIASSAAGGPLGIAVGVTWTLADSWAQSQHYVPLMGADAGRDINGWEAVSIRAQEQDERAVRKYENQGMSRTRAEDYHRLQEMIERNRIDSLRRR